MFSHQTPIRFRFHPSVLLLAGLLLVWSHPVYAQTAGQIDSGNLGSVTLQIVDALSVLVSVLHVLLLLCLKIASFLLSSAFFLQPNMMSVLKNIWLLSRDIVNIIFAFMLIGVAFMTILKGDSSLVKEKIVHFVMAVILVNFSWFFPRVIIDVSSVLTATVYSIPNMLPAYTCKYIEDQPADAVGPPVSEECRALADFELFPDAVKVTQFYESNGCNKNDKEEINKGRCHCDEGIACWRTDTMTNVKKRFGGSHAILSGLAISFGKITTLPQVPKSDVGRAIASQVNGPSRTLQMLINIFFAIVIQAFVTFPVIALTLGLIIRIVIMWVTIAFMPFAFLGYAMTGKPTTAIFGNDKDVFMEFLKAAFMPTVVAVPLVIGLVMVSASSTIAAPDIGAKLDLPLVSGVSTWWSMLWIIAACMIIWHGAFGALSKSGSIIGGIADKVKGIGGGLGSAITRLPGFLPAPFPGAGTKGDTNNIGSYIAGLQTNLSNFGKFRAALSRPGGATPEGIKIENSIKTGIEGSNEKLTEMNRILAKISTATTASDVNTHMVELKTKLGVSASMTNAELMRELQRIKSTPAAGIDTTALANATAQLDAAASKVTALAPNT